MSAALSEFPRILDLFFNALAEKPSLLPIVNNLTMARDMLKYSSVYFFPFKFQSEGLMVCAFTHQSCFHKQSLNRAVGFLRSSLRAWVISEADGRRQHYRYQKGFRVTDLTHPCYTCGWGRTPWPSPVTSWWPHQPYGVQGTPHTMMGTQRLASWPWWAQEPA